MGNGIELSADRWKFFVVAKGFIADAEVHLVGRLFADAEPARTKHGFDAGLLGTHQFVGSPAKWCSINAILGHPDSWRASRSSIDRLC